MQDSPCQEFIDKWHKALEGEHEAQMHASLLEGREVPRDLNIEASKRSEESIEAVQEFIRAMEKSDRAEQELKECQAKNALQG